MIKMIAKVFRLAVVLAVLPAIPATSNVIPEALQRFANKRLEIASDLAQQVAYCVGRRDTSHPAFHGCIDWHSSVHGVWALIAYTRMSGDHRYQHLIDAALAPQVLEAERLYLLQHPEFEMPYGRAWFLRLVVDYRRTFGNTALDAFGDQVAESMVAFYRERTPQPESVDYASAAWALVNLYEYATERSDSRTTDFVVDIIQRRFVNAGPCPAAKLERPSTGFMSVCMTWAWLVSKVKKPQDMLDWMHGFLPDAATLDPVARARTAHQAGLNFSRSWGYWATYWKTDDPAFLNAYLNHFYASYNQPASWRGDYATVGHWVAQFGMLAVFLSYRDWPNN